MPFVSKIVEDITVFVVGSFLLPHNEHNWRLVTFNILTMNFITSIKRHSAKTGIKRMSYFTEYQMDCYLL